MKIRKSRSEIDLYIKFKRDQGYQVSSINGRTVLTKDCHQVIITFTKNSWVSIQDIKI